MDRTIRSTRHAAGASRKAWLAASTALALSLASNAYALPTGGEVSAGQAGISGAGSTLTVSQTSNEITGLATILII